MRVEEGLAGLGTECGGLRGNPVRNPLTPNPGVAAQHAADARVGRHGNARGPSRRVCLGSTAECRGSTADCLGGTEESLGSTAECL